MRRCALARFSLLSALLIAPRPAAAHEWWLTATPWHAGVGDTVELRAWAGSGAVGMSQRFDAAHARRLAVRARGSLDLLPAARDSAVTFARWAVSDPGGMTFAFESDFTSIELPAAEFEARLEAEGLTWVSRSRQRRGHSDRPGRVRFARCARTWVHGDSSARATAAMGMALEFVPLASPDRPGPAAVELRLRGRPLTASLVRLWRRPPRSAPTDSSTPVFQARTDLDGRVRLPDLGPGFYLASTVHMEPCPDRGEADWQSLWSSLSFVRRIER